MIQFGFALVLTILFVWGVVLVLDQRDKRTHRVDDREPEPEPEVTPDDETPAIEPVTEVVPIAPRSMIPPRLERTERRYRRHEPATEPITEPIPVVVDNTVPLVRPYTEQSPLAPPFSWFPLQPLTGGRHARRDSVDERHTDRRRSPPRHAR